MSEQRSMEASSGARSADHGVLRRVTAATAFGEGLDGYDLGVISVVLPLASSALDLTTVEEGCSARRRSQGSSSEDRSSAT
jgi:putative MFS transporter